MDELILSLRFQSSSALGNSSLRVLHRLPQSRVAGATASIEDGCSAGALQSPVMSLLRR